jgi:hypothetical protein
LDRRLGEPQEQSGLCEEEKKNFPLPAIEGDITNQSYPSTNQSTDIEGLGGGLLEIMAIILRAAPPPQKKIAHPSMSITVTEFGIQNWGEGGSCDDSETFVTFVCLLVVYLTTLSVIQESKQFCRYSDGLRAEQPGFVCL